MPEELKNKILTILSNHKIGTLATIQDSRPYSRFMMFFHEDLVLYTATNKDTHKVDEIKQNPNVHVLLGYEGTGWNDSYVEIEATASISDNQELKSKYWNNCLTEWLSSPDDPEYVLLQLTPESIRYYEKAGSKPEVLQ